MTDALDEQFADDGAFRAAADAVYQELLDRMGESNPRPRLEPTRRAVELLGARLQDVRMVFTEITPDIVANGGVLASEDAGRAGVVAALAERA